MIGGMESACEVLTPGVYRLSDGRKLTVKPADVANAAKQGNAMIGAGLRVPGCWEHDTAAMPKYESNPNWQLAKGYYGDVKRYELRGGRLIAVMGFKDPSDLSQFKKVGTVSPRIVFNRIDERGKRWPGLTIAHVASTPTPVQRDQSRVPYDFSATAAEAQRTGYYDLSTGAGKDMAAETDTGSDTGGGDIIPILEKMGLKLGEGATPENLAHRLEALAANGCTFNMNGASGTDVDGDGLDDGVESEVEGGAGDDIGNAPNATSPMVMSQLPKPLQLQATNAITGHKNRMIDETKGFFKAGKIDRATAQKHIARVKAANLSLTNGWTLRITPEVAAHDTLKSLPARPGWKASAADLSNLGTVDAPIELTGPEAEKPGENRALNYALARAGIATPAK